jgi:hypothetical protein
MNKQNRKVNNVKIRNRHSPPPRAPLHYPILPPRESRLAIQQRRALLHKIPRYSCWQTESPGHDPVTQIVDVARRSPPSGDDEFRPRGCLHVLQVRDAGVRRVGAEAVLLVVRAAENVVPQTENGENAGVTGEAEGEGVDGEIARLQTVDERHPSEVAEGEHEPEAIGGDVHGGQHGGFHVEGVEDVEGLEEGDENDRVGDVAVGLVLVRDECDVEEDPAEESRAQLAENFDVDLPEDGEGDARVELAADEPVVEHVAGVAAGGELAHLFVAGLDAEAADVDEGREGEGDEHVGGDDLGVVVPDVGPDWEVGALRDGTGEEENDGEDGGGKS